MKKFIAFALLLTMLALPAFAADTKVTALTENTAPAASDLLYIVDDPGGSPLSQKITVANLAANMPDIVVEGSDLTVADAGVKMTGSNGSLTFLGVGDGTDEDLTLDLNAANVATLTSSTGVDNIVGVASYSLGAAGVKLTGDGDGAITLLGLGNGSDEDLTLNLDDVSNEVTVSSSTGVTLVDLDGAIDLEISGNDLTLGEAGVKFTSDGDGAVTLLGLGDGSDEDLTINLDDTANTIVLSSSTSADSIVGLASYSLGAAGVKLTGDGDGAITLLGLGNGSDEDLTINLDDTADTAVVSSSTGVTSISTGAIGLTSTGAVTSASHILTPTAIASLGAATLGKMVITSDSGANDDCTTASGSGSNLCIGDGAAFVFVKNVKATA